MAALHPAGHSLDASHPRVVAQAARIAELEVVIAELRGQLRKSSRNSSKPPSSEGAGRLGWVHSASTQTLTRYISHHKRGIQAMQDAGVLPGFRGVAVHDGWKPFAAYTQAIHALCAGAQLAAGQAWMPAQAPG